MTVELFTRWKTAFDSEMAEKERIEKGLKKEDPKMLKPTGKELHSPFRTPLVMPIAIQFAVLF